MIDFGNVSLKAAQQEQRRFVTEQVRRLLYDIYNVNKPTSTLAFMADLLTDAYASQICLADAVRLKDDSKNKMAKESIEWLVFRMLHTANQLYPRLSLGTTDAYKSFDELTANDKASFSSVVEKFMKETFPTL